MDCGETVIHSSRLFSLLVPPTIATSGTSLKLFLPITCLLPKLDLSFMGHCNGFLIVFAISDLFPRANGKLL